MADDEKISLPFAKFLKFWREVHELSQEDLAARLDSSTRHISRLENSSSRPSENFIEDIAKTLDLGERDRNHLRIAAGFNAKQTPTSFLDPQLKWLRNVMRLTLQSLDPHPTTLTDSVGNIMMVNKAWVGFYQKALPRIKLDDFDNIYDFIFSSEGSGPIISDADNTRSLILMSVQQAVMLDDSEEKKQLLDRLLKSPNIPANWKQRAANLEPMASFKLQIKVENSLLQFYSVSHNFGGAGPTAYISEPKLTINTLYPIDESMDLSPLSNGDIRHPLLDY